LPSRNARNGTVYTWDGPLHYKAARHAKELDIPLDSKCDCYTCQNFSRGYVRHLFRSGEISALQLATIHSIHFFVQLMKEARKQILSNEFEKWSADLLQHWKAKKDEN
jgi:queuine tRNA-ribosyltransferase